jgi:anthraniloyl-CoA monooxygenase
MKIACVGGGPAALYFAISAKRRDAGLDIAVYERNPEGATYGWGVVYWDNLLDLLYRNDYDSAHAIRAASRLWQQQQIRLRGRTAYLGGYGYSITRSTLLHILTDRARALGVHVHHEAPVPFDTTAPISANRLDADIVVAADGAHSGTRDHHRDAFGTRISSATNRYLWLGTDTVLDTFLFSFASTPAGWMWIHAYPSSPTSSTCIVETTDRTWKELGFDELGTDATLRVLEDTFRDDLHGGHLITQHRGPSRQPAAWQQFTEVSNRTWRFANTVLVGDAAHTTHFTIGSGTRLGMIDGIALAQSLYDHADPDEALHAYDQRRRPELRHPQASARTSSAWFENLDHYLQRHGHDPIAFAYAMSGRQGQQPPWRLQKHLATQTPVGRSARRRYDTTRRWYGAWRRGQTPLLPTVRATTARHN